MLGRMKILCSATFKHSPNPTSTVEYLRQVDELANLNGTLVKGDAIVWAEIKNVGNCR